MKLLHKHHKKADSPKTHDDQIFEFLSKQKTGVLATVDPNNNPHATVLYYTIERPFAIKFTTKKGTKKSDNITHNNRAMLVAYDETSQTVAQVTGKVSAVEGDKATHEAFMDTLRASLETAQSAIPPISRVDAGEYVAYELRPVEVKMTVYKRPSSESRGIKFETIAIPILNLGN